MQPVSHGGHDAQNRYRSRKSCMTDACLTHEKWIVGPLPLPYSLFIFVARHTQVASRMLNLPLCFDITAFWLLFHNSRLFSDFSACIARQLVFFCYIGVRIWIWTPDSYLFDHNLELVIKLVWFIHENQKPVWTWEVNDTAKNWNCFFFLIYISIRWWWIICGSVVSVCLSVRLSFSPRHKW